MPLDISRPRKDCFAHVYITLWDLSLKGSSVAMTRKAWWCVRVLAVTSPSFPGKPLVDEFRAQSPCLPWLGVLIESGADDESI